MSLKNTLSMHRDKTVRSKSQKSHRRRRRRTVMLETIDCVSGAVYFTFKLKTSFVSVSLQLNRVWGKALWCGTKPAESGGKRGFSQDNKSHDESTGATGRWDGFQTLQHVLQSNTAGFAMFLMWTQTVELKKQEVCVQTGTKQHHTKSQSKMFGPPLAAV